MICDDRETCLIEKTAALSNVIETQCLWAIACFDSLHVYNIADCRLLSPNLLSKLVSSAAAAILQITLVRPFSYQ